MFQNLNAMNLTDSWKDAFNGESAHHNAATYPPIPVFERTKTFLALDRMATVIGRVKVKEVKLSPCVTN
jgi:hypothetical protein